MNMRLYGIVVLLMLHGCDTLQQESSDAGPSGKVEDVEPQFEFTLLEPSNIDEQVQAWITGKSGHEDLQVSRAEVGYYLDVQEAQLQQALRGDNISLLREGDSFLIRITGAFETNSSSPNAALQSVLDSVARVVSEFRKTLVIVHSHTDSVGAPGYNRWLSEQRAIAVAGYLVDQGVVAERVAAIGHGESNPLPDSGNTEARSVNRRLEIALALSVKE